MGLRVGPGWRLGAARRVYGASDRVAAYPTAQPHAPRYMAATIYHLLGIPAEATTPDQTMRSHALVVGQKIDGLLI